MNQGAFRDLDWKCEEDWKAAIYAWGGPKPSLISHTKVDFDRETGGMVILFLEKRHDPELISGVQQERSSHYESEEAVGPDGGVQS